LIVFDITLVTPETAVSRRHHVQLLIAARTLGTVVLQPAEILDIAVIENVVPRTLVVHRDANELALRRHRMLIPECSVRRASPHQVELRLGFSLAFQPAKRVLIL